MATNADALEELAGLLAQIGATPVVRQERLAMSPLYDADYHRAIVACAFVTHAKREPDGLPRLLAPWLKLLQFVAARPRLVPQLRAWVGTRRNADLETWRNMPRGFLGDSTHDATVDYLVASAVLRREKDNLVAGPRVEVLHVLDARLRNRRLFTLERNVLEGLLDVRPNRTMLSGA